MMSHGSLTRREAMKLGTAMALPLLAAPALQANADSAAAKPLTIGMATTEFSTFSNRQMAEEMARVGVHTVQLFLTQTDSRYWKYNNRSDISTLTEERCRAIADTYRSAGIAIHSIGVYTNLIHPEESERKANLAYFEGMMKVGKIMGVRSFITEAGHYRSDKPAPPVPYDFQENVWKQMIATGKELAELAERYDATVLFEAYSGGFLASAKRTRVFLEEIGSPRMRALLDPANLLEMNDLEEMFQQLKPWIDCLHAKDRKLHVSRGVAAGKGDLDYHKFVTLAAKHTPNAPLILEYVGAKTYAQALSHLRNAIQQAGLTAK